LKIIEIHIYGYGKLENIIIDNINQHQVFFGENEAGKSTIMSFIHSILFGFPTKQQNELRYEPKHHTKYGGKLMVYHPVEGIVMIERVKGKAAGDVVVKLENGTIGSEELLSKLLKKMDKSMYQAIYSFNLQGLQNIHQIKNEDLGKFLFSTSAVGTDKLLKVENELKKVLENSFKPGGKKPEINERLKEIHELEQKLKEAQHNNDSYGTFIQRKMILEQEILQMQTEIKILQNQIIQLNKWKVHFNEIQELHTLHLIVKDSSNSTFPIDGITRLDALKQLINPLEAQLAGLKDRQVRLNDRLSACYNQVNQEMLKQEERIEEAVASLPLLNRLTAELSEMAIQKEVIRDRIQYLKAQLYHSVDEKDLVDIDTSIFMKEEIEKSKAMFYRLAQQGLMLDNRFQEEKGALEQTEKEISYIENQLLPEPLKSSHIQRLKEIRTVEQMKEELKEIQEKMDYFRLSKQGDEKKAVNSKMQTSFIFIIFLFILIWSGLKGEWILLAVTVCSLLLLTGLLLKKDNEKEVSGSPLAALLERQAFLSKEIARAGGIDGDEVESLQIKIQRDDKLKETLDSLKLKWSQQQFRYEQVIESFERWELEKKENDTKIRNIYQNLKLSERIPFEQFTDAYQIITELKDLAIDEQKLIGRMNQIENKKAGIHSLINQIAEQFLLDKQTNPIDYLTALKEALKAAQHNAADIQTLENELKELESNSITLSREKQYLLDELQKLFEEAGVETEDEFRLKGKEVKTRDEILGRIKVIENQIKLAGFSLSEYSEYKDLADIDKQIEVWNHSSNNLEALIKKGQMELADINFQINLLEDGGTYTELLHRYKLQKNELNDRSKSWGAYAVAKHLLSKTMERYQNEKLPSLLLKAEEYLKFLTRDHYIRIYPKNTEGNGFLVERSDHSIFEANELSQATKEQIYVSIRLALATTLYEEYRFPIIIDDSFVNFDEYRTKRVLTLLNTIKDHQILFFTCHSHLLTYFHSTQIYNLEKNEKVY
jgi:uncharacterized protein YhaN